MQLLALFAVIGAHAALAQPAAASAGASATRPAAAPQSGADEAPTIVAAQPSTSADTGFDLTRPDIRAYIDQLVNDQQLDRNWVTAVLAAARAQPQILDAMNRPAEKVLQWWQYRAHFLTERRIEAGARLWREHRELLDQVAVEQRVPPEYVIAILGIETAYGHTTGRYRVLDALATLAFDYPARAVYFRKELAQFLLLARDDGIDPLTTTGSYAGAMGAAQFMPSSYRAYAVSEDGGRRRDLWTNWGDIFASVAYYFHANGWQYGAPVIADAQPPVGQTLMPPEQVTLDQTLGGLRGQGLRIDSGLPDDSPAILLGAPLEDAMSYRVGFHNFYVITRYNRSPLYAMAVCDLAAAIRTRVLADDSP